MTEETKEILELKRKLEESGIDYENSKTEISR